MATEKRTHENLRTRITRRGGNLVIKLRLCKGDESRFVRFWCIVYPPCRCGGDNLLADFLQGECVCRNRLLKSLLTLADFLRWNLQCFNEMSSSKNGAHIDEINEKDENHQNNWSRNANHNILGKSPLHRASLW